MFGARLLRQWKEAKFRPDGADKMLGVRLIGLKMV